MPSFDIFSKVDMQEVDNALNQATKEIAQRYDFKGTETSVALGEDKKSIVVKANSDGRVLAAVEVLQGKLVKRGVPLKAVVFGKVEPIGGDMVRQVATLQQGIPVEKGRDIVKAIKDAKMKVQASIQGDQLRVSGKARDDLQACIQLVRGQDFGVDLQFGNFRD
ncbi:MAG TPA: YajQ family cyclic di-GMP-binding protein [Myxococcales bacterium]|jgi:cyclic-di-GMP-binding protein|nr:YajQ family cyclic di-GMP-binding protein [Myxococcales bacterium]